MAKKFPFIFNDLPQTKQEQIPVPTDLTSPKTNFATVLNEIEPEVEKINKQKQIENFLNSLNTGTISQAPGTFPQPQQTPEILKPLYTPTEQPTDTFPSFTAPQPPQQPQELQPPQPQTTVDYDQLYGSRTGVIQFSLDAKEQAADLDKLPQGFDKEFFAPEIQAFKDYLNTGKAPSLTSLIGVPKEQIYTNEGVRNAVKSFGISLLNKLIPFVSYTDRERLVEQLLKNYNPKAYRGDKPFDTFNDLIQSSIAAGYTLEDLPVKLGKNTAYVEMPVDAQIVKDLFDVALTINQKYGINLSPADKATNKIIELDDPENIVKKASIEAENIRTDLQTKINQFIEQINSPLAGVSLSSNVDQVEALKSMGVTEDNTPVSQAILGSVTDNLSKNPLPIGTAILQSIPQLALGIIPVVGTGAQIYDLFGGIYRNPLTPQDLANSTTFAAFNYASLAASAISDLAAVGKIGSAVLGSIPKFVNTAAIQTIRTAVTSLDRIALKPVSIVGLTANVGAMGTQFYLTNPEDRLRFFVDQALLIGIMGKHAFNLARSLGIPNTIEQLRQNHYLYNSDTGEFFKIVANNSKPNIISYKLEKVPETEAKTIQKAAEQGDIQVIVTNTSELSVNLIKPTEIVQTDLDNTERIILRPNEDTLSRGANVSQFDGAIIRSTDPDTEPTTYFVINSDRIKSAIDTQNVTSEKAKAVANADTLVVKIDPQNNRAKLVDHITDQIVKGLEESELKVKNRDAIKAQVETSLSEQIVKGDNNYRVYEISGFRGIASMIAHPRYQTDSFKPTYRINEEVLKYAHDLDAFDNFNNLRLRLAVIESLKERGEKLPDMTVKSTAFLYLSRLDKMANPKNFASQILTVVRDNNTGKLSLKYDKIDLQALGYLIERNLLDLNFRVTESGKTFLQTLKKKLETDRSNIPDLENFKEFFEFTQKTDKELSSAQKSDEAYIPNLYNVAELTPAQASVAFFLDKQGIITIDDEGFFVKPSTAEILIKLSQTPKYTSSDSASSQIAFLQSEIAKTKIPANAESDIIVKQRITETLKSAKQDLDNGQYGSAYTKIQELSNYLEKYDSPVFTTFKSNLKNVKEKLANPAIYDLKPVLDKLTKQGVLKDATKSPLTIDTLKSIKYQEQAQISVKNQDGTTSTYTVRRSKTGWVVQDNQNNETLIFPTILDAANHLKISARELADKLIPTEIYPANKKKLSEIQYTVDTSSITIKAEPISLDVTTIDKSQPTLVKYQLADRTIPVLYLPDDKFKQFGTYGVTISDKAKLVDVVSLDQETINKLNLNDFDKFIVINSSQTPADLRTTLAEELTHFLTSEYINKLHGDFEKLLERSKKKGKTEISEVMQAFANLVVTYNRYVKPNTLDLKTFLHEIVAKTPDQFFSAFRDLLPQIDARSLEFIDQNADIIRNHIANELIKDKVTFEKLYNLSVNEQERTKLEANFITLQSTLNDLLTYTNLKTLSTVELELTASGKKWTDNLQKLTKEAVNVPKLEEDLQKLGYKLTSFDILDLPDIVKTKFNALRTDFAEKLRKASTPHEKVDLFLNYSKNLHEFTNTIKSVLDQTQKYLTDDQLKQIYKVLGGEITGIRESILKSNTDKYLSDFKEFAVKFKDEIETLRNILIDPFGTFFGKEGLKELLTFDITSPTYHKSKAILERQIAAFNALLGIEDALFKIKKSTTDPTQSFVSLREGLVKLFLPENPEEIAKNIIQFVRENSQNYETIITLFNQVKTLNRTIKDFEQRSTKSNDFYQKIESKYSDPYQESLLASFNTQIQEFTRDLMRMPLSEEEFQRRFADIIAYHEILYTTLPILAEKSPSPQYLLRTKTFPNSTFEQPMSGFRVILDKVNQFYKTADTNDFQILHSQLVNKLTTDATLDQNLVKALKLTDSDSLLSRAFYLKHKNQIEENARKQSTPPDENTPSENVSKPSKSPNESIESAEPPKTDTESSIESPKTDTSRKDEARELVQEIVKDTETDVETVERAAQLVTQASQPPKQLTKTDINKILTKFSSDLLTDPNEALINLVDELQQYTRYPEPKVVTDVAPVDLRTIANSPYKSVLYHATTPLFTTPLDKRLLKGLKLPKYEQSVTYFDLAQAGIYPIFKQVDPTKSNFELVNETIQSIVTVLNAYHPAENNPLSEVITTIRRSAEFLELKKLGQISEINDLHELLLATNELYKKLQADLDTARVNTKNLSRQLLLTTSKLQTEILRQVLTKSFGKKDLIQIINEGNSHIILGQLYDITTVFSKLMDSNPDLAVGVLNQDSILKQVLGQLTTFLNEQGAVYESITKKYVDDTIAAVERAKQQLYPESRQPIATKPGSARSDVTEGGTGIDRNRIVTLSGFFPINQPLIPSVNKITNPELLNATSSIDELHTSVNIPFTTHALETSSSLRRAVFRKTLDLLIKDITNGKGDTEKYRDTLDAVSSDKSNLTLTANLLDPNTDVLTSLNVLRTAASTESKRLTDLAKAYKKIDSIEKDLNYYKDEFAPTSSSLLETPEFIQRLEEVKNLARTYTEIAKKIAQKFPRKTFENFIKTADRIGKDIVELDRLDAEIQNLKQRSIELNDQLQNAKGRSKTKLKSAIKETESQIEKLEKSRNKLQAKINKFKTQTIPTFLDNFSTKLSKLQLDSSLQTKIEKLGTLLADTENLRSKLTALKASYEDIGILKNLQTYSDQLSDPEILKLLVQNGKQDEILSSLEQMEILSKQLIPDRALNLSAVKTKVQKLKAKSKNATFQKIADEIAKATSFTKTTSKLNKTISKISEINDVLSEIHKLSKSGSLELADVDGNLNTLAGAFKQNVTQALTNTLQSIKQPNADQIKSEISGRINYLDLPRQVVQSKFSKQIELLRRIDEDFQETTANDLSTFIGVVETRQTVSPYDLLIEKEVDALSNKKLELLDKIEQRKQELAKTGKTLIETADGEFILKNKQGKSIKPDATTSALLEEYKSVNEKLTDLEAELNRTSPDTNVTRIEEAALSSLSEYGSYVTERLEGTQLTEKLDRVKRELPVLLNFMKTIIDPSYTYSVRLKIPDYLTQGNYVTIASSKKQTKQISGDSLLQVIDLINFKLQNLNLAESAKFTDDIKLIRDLVPIIKGTTTSNNQAIASKLRSKYFGNINDPEDVAKVATHLTNILLQPLPKNISGDFTSINRDSQLGIAGKVVAVRDDADPSVIRTLTGLNNTVVKLKKDSSDYQIISNNILKDLAFTKRQLDKLETPPPETTRKETQSIETEPLRPAESVIRAINTSRLKEEVPTSPVVNAVVNFYKYARIDKIEDVRQLGKAFIEKYGEKTTIENVLNEFINPVFKEHPINIIKDVGKNDFFDNADQIIDAVRVTLGADALPDLEKSMLHERLTETYVDPGALENLKNELSKPISIHESAQKTVELLLKLFNLDYKITRQGHSRFVKIKNLDQLKAPDFLINFDRLLKFASIPHFGESTIGFTYTQKMLEAPGLTASSILELPMVHFLSAHEQYQLLTLAHLADMAKSVPFSKLKFQDRLNKFNPGLYLFTALYWKEKKAETRKVLLDLATALHPDLHIKEDFSLSGLSDLSNMVSSLTSSMNLKDISVPKKILRQPTTLLELKDAIQRVNEIVDKAKSSEPAEFLKYLKENGIDIPNFAEHIKSETQRIALLFSIPKHSNNNRILDILVGKNLKEVFDVFRFTMPTKNNEEIAKYIISGFKNHPDYEHFQTPTYITQLPVSLISLMSDVKENIETNAYVPHSNVFTNLAVNYGLGLKLRDLLEHAVRNPGSDPLTTDLLFNKLSYGDDMFDPPQVITRRSLIQFAETVLETPLTKQEKSKIEIYLQKYKAYREAVARYGEYDEQVLRNRAKGYYMSREDVINTILQWKLDSPFSLLISASSLSLLAGAALVNNILTHLFLPIFMLTNVAKFYVEQALGRILPSEFKDNYTMFLPPKEQLKLTINFYRQYAEQIATRVKLLKQNPDQDVLLSTEDASLARKVKTGIPWLAPIEKAINFAWSVYGIFDASNFVAFKRAYTQALVEYEAKRSGNPNFTEDHLTNAQKDFIETLALVATFRQGGILTDSLNKAFDQITEDADIRMLTRVLEPFSKTAESIAQTQLSLTPLALLHIISPIAAKKVFKANKAKIFNHEVLLSEQEQDARSLLRAHIAHYLTNGMLGTAMLLAPIGGLFDFLIDDDESLDTFGITPIDSTDIRRARTSGESFGTIRIGDYSIRLESLTPYIFPFMLGLTIRRRYLQDREKIKDLQTQRANLMQNLSDKELQYFQKLDDLKLELQMLDENKDSLAPQTYQKRRAELLKQMDDITKSSEFFRADMYMKLKDIDKKLEEFNPTQLRVNQFNQAVKAVVKSYPYLSSMMDIFQTGKPLQTLLQKITPMLFPIPAIIREIDRYTDPTLRKAETTLESLMVNIPFLRRYVTSVKDLFGNDVTRQPLFPGAPLSLSELPPKSALRKEIERLDLPLPNPESETTKAYSAQNFLQIEKFLQSNNPRYLSLPEEEKTEFLQSMISAAKTQNPEMFEKNFNYKAKTLVSDMPTIVKQIRTSWDDFTINLNSDADLKQKYPELVQIAIGKYLDKTSTPTLIMDYIKKRSKIVNNTLIDAGDINPEIEINRKLYEKYGEAFLFTNFLKSQSRSIFKNIDFSVQLRTDKSNVQSDIAKQILEKKYRGLELRNQLLNNKTNFLKVFQNFNKKL